MWSIFKRIVLILRKTKLKTTRKYLSENRNSVSIYKISNLRISQENLRKDRRQKNLTQIYDELLTEK